MRIKEVETRTGLTAKAIRLYESKGLLKPARETENDYRDYTEEDVQRLKTIAVLRRLDVSIKEIKEWCDGEADLSDLLHRVAAEAMLEAGKMDDRLKLTAELAKILDEEPDKPLSEAVEEAEELRQLYEELEAAKEDLHGVLLWPVWTTLIALGPVGWTGFRIWQGQTEDALWSLAISLVVLPFVCWQWFKYFQVDKNKRKSGCLPALIFGVCGLLAAFGSLFLVSILQQVLFAPESGYYLFRPGWVAVTMGYPMLVIWFVVESFSVSDDEIEEEPTGTEEPEEEMTLAEKLKLLSLAVVFHMLLLYGCLTGVSFFSEGQFVRHGLLHPMGQIYDLSEVEQVEAGFYSGWHISPWKQKGDFYYKVTFADGKTENWAQLSNGGEEDSDPWEDLLEFDRILMEAGVEKVTNTKYREYFDYDPSCLEICDEIINNR